MEPSCTCIIPFYNEGQRVVHVLKTLVQIPSLQSIILVNDGSTDHAVSLLETYIAHSGKQHITIISYPQNRGKSHAVKQGVQLVQTPYVFLCDADLVDIDTNEIIYMIQNMYMHPEIDMGILRCQSAGWYTKLIGGDIGLSGLRMVKTLDLKNTLAGKVERYQLETAINLYMGQKKKTVVWFPFSGDDIRKNKKQGFFVGLKKEALMYYDIFTYQKFSLLAKYTLFWKPLSIHQYTSKKLNKQKIKEIDSDVLL